MATVTSSHPTSALSAAFSPIEPAVPRIGEDEPPPSWDFVLTPTAMVGRGSPKLSMIPKGSPKFGRMLSATSTRMKRVCPQSRLAKKSASSPKGSQVKQRAIWNAELEKSLVEIFFEYKDSGYRGYNGWNTEGWNRMVKEFHARNKCISFTKNQVQEKEGQLKRDYKMLKVARQQSGSSWNEKRCMVEGSPAMWQNLQISFPKIKKFRNNKASFPLYDALGELYDSHLAEGKYNCTSLDSMEDEEPLRLVQELEDDSQHQDDVVLLEDQRNSIEEETDVVLLEDQRNPSEKETQAVDSRIVTEEQRRRALIAERRQQKEDKKTSKNSRVERMMDRYLEMRSKQREEEVTAREKEFSQAAEYSVKKCVSMLSSMDVTKQEKAKAYAVFKTIGKSFCVPAKMT